MKNVIILLLLTFCVNGYGQIINFPDPNFKNALVNTLCVDTDGLNGPDADADLNNDGEIDLNEGKLIKRLHLVDKNIESLDKFELFDSLNFISLTNNKIKKINFNNFLYLEKIESAYQDTVLSIFCRNLPKLIEIDVKRTILDSLYLDNLDILENIYLAGINFANLSINELPKVKELTCSYSSFKSISLSNLQSLETLHCDWNPLENLNLFNLPKLNYIYCPRVNLSSLSLSDLPSLSNLHCRDNIFLKTLELINLPKLNSIRCFNTGIKSLELVNMPSLSFLLCNDNKSLTNLILKNVPELRFLYCNMTSIISLELIDQLKLNDLNIKDNPSMKSLKINNLPLLESVECDNNKSLKDIYLKDLPLLSKINCYETNVDTLEIKDFPNLVTLGISGNYNLKSLKLSNLPKLPELTINSTNIKSLEIKNLPKLTYFFASDNNNLTSLWIEGTPVTYFSCKSSSLENLIFIKKWMSNDLHFSNCFNLKYICCSNELFGQFQQKVLQYGYSNVNINPYCSFDPFGDYGVISGSIKYSNDNICDQSDISLKSFNFNISGLGTLLFHGPEKYKIALNTGLYKITPIYDKQKFNVTPESVSVNIIKNTTKIQDFCITPKGTFRQTNITVIPLSPPARPGFNAFYKIVWENTGNQIESGTLNFKYDERLLDYISATQTADQVADGIIKWNFSNLLPFEKREITVTLKVNRPTDTPAVNAGDKLYLTASILDNIFTLENTVVGSYDPNDKTCLQGDRVKPDMVGKYVDYLIRFENTGNYAAENVVIKDIIDTKTFDVSSLQINDASHEVYTRIEGNKVEFIFENIQLPFDDANNDGYVAFKIKTLPTLVLGDSLKNLADIYFDYNFPIRTNEAQTTIALPVFTKDITTEVNIYPNPVIDMLHLDTKENWTKAEIYDISGRIMRSVTLGGQSLDVSGLESGTYFVRLKDGEKVGVVKFVKI
jgi:uncharacterized repeat protein (TIGR01451 family)